MICENNTYLPRLVPFSTCHAPEVEETVEQVAALVGNFVARLTRQAAGVLVPGPAARQAAIDWDLCDMKYVCCCSE